MRLTLRQGVDRQNGHVVDGQGGQEGRREAGGPLAITTGGEIAALS